MRRLITFLSGAALGSMTGAMLALLMAPDSGDALRSQLRGQYLRIQAEVRQAAADRRGELEQELELLRTPRKPDAA